MDMGQVQPGRAGIAAVPDLQPVVTGHKYGSPTGKLYSCTGMAGKSDWITLESRQNQRVRKDHTLLEAWKVEEAAAGHELLI